MTTTANSVSTNDYLKYANLQMAAEALFRFDANLGIQVPGDPLNQSTRYAGSLDVAVLVDGNRHASKFVQSEAQTLSDNWTVIDHIPDTTTGFSGTLFKNKDTGELVLSFRSTEFIDDAARDNTATNYLEIRSTGFALGQIDDMQRWFKDLQDNGKITGPLTVTGYSLGGHLATAFNLLHVGEQAPDGGSLVKQVYTFNGAGLGLIDGGYASLDNLKDLIGIFHTLRQLSSTDLRDVEPLEGEEAPEFASVVLLSEKGRTAYAALQTQLASDQGKPTQALVSSVATLMEPLGGQSQTSDEVHDQTLLEAACLRILTVSKTVDALPTLHSGNPDSNAPDTPADVPLSDMIAATLDYQLAVLATKEYLNTASPSAYQALMAARGERALAPLHLSNQVDIVGTEMNGGNALSMVANSGVHYGQTQEIFIENQPLLRGAIIEEVIVNSLSNLSPQLLGDNYYSNDFGDTHSLVLLVDSLKVQSVLQVISPGLSQRSINEIFKLASNLQAKEQVGAQGRSEGDVLEKVLNALSSMFAVANPVKLNGNPNGNSWADLDGATVGGITYTGRNKFYEALAAIEDSDLFEALASGEIKASINIGLGSGSGALQAPKGPQGDFGKYMALHALSPFSLAFSSQADVDAAISLLNAPWSNQWKSDRALLDQNPDLDLSDPRLQVTQSWLIDRAAMLDRLEWFNTKNLKLSDPTYISEGGDEPYLAESAYFKDEASGQEIQHGAIYNNTVIYRFGDNENNAYEGKGVGDHLYGGGGNDILQGGDGNDYLQGDDDVDRLDGGGDADTLIGGNGADVMIGGAGADLLRGGKDADAYQFETGWGHDIIEDDGGEGRIKVNGQDLPTSAAKKVAENFYKDKATGWMFSKTDIAVDGSSTLVIRKEDDQDNSITILNWKNGQLGISLSATQESAPPISRFYFGDQRPPLDEDGNYDWSKVEWVANGALQGGVHEDAFDDVIAADEGNSEMYGYGGNDALAGMGGNDSIDGGVGDDLISGGAGSDSLDGGVGNDFIFGGVVSGLLPDNDRRSPQYDYWTENGRTPPPNLNVRAPTWGVVGTTDPHDEWGWGVYGIYPTGPRSPVVDDDPDVIHGGAGEDIVIGGFGDDYLDGGGENDNLYGLAGNDLIIGGAGSDYISGDGRGIGAGEETSGRMDSLVSTRVELHGADILDGGAGNDSITGQGGGDQLFGGEGDDLLYGDDDHWYDHDYVRGNPLVAEFQGKDYLDGGDGNDELIGGADDDTLYGGQNNDVLYGDGDRKSDASLTGNDYLDGETGEDQLTGGNGNDTLYGGVGNDLLLGDGWSSDASSDLDGNDYLDGEDGDDKLYGQAGNDTLVGSAGADQLQGGSGNDVLVAGEGLDALFGQAGNDTLSSEDGNDYLNGGGGDDVYNIDVNLKAVVLVDDSGGVNKINLTGMNTSSLKVFSQGGRIFLSDGAALLAISGQTDLASLKIYTGKKPAAPTTSQRAMSLLNEDDADVISDTTVAALVDEASGGTGLLKSGYWTGEEIVETSTITVAQNIGGTVSNEWLQGGSGSDSINGDGGADVLEGGGGSDVIYGGAGSDTISGNIGNDVLSGTDSSGFDDSRDVYCFNRGDGIDLIQAGGGSDMAPRDLIRFGEGITLADLSVSRLSGGGLEQLVIDYGLGDKILFSVGGETSIEGLEFADQSVLSMAQLLAMLPPAHIDETADPTRIHGTTANDVLQGKILDERIDGDEGNDLLIGGAGDDLLIGGAGNNIYRFSPGSGNDMLSITAGETGMLIFDGIGNAQLTARIVGKDLLLSTSETDSVRLINYTTQVTQIGQSWQVKMADGEAMALRDVVESHLAPATDGSLDSERQAFMGQQWAQMHVLGQRWAWFDLQDMVVPVSVVKQAIAMSPDQVLDYSSYLTMSQTNDVTTSHVSAPVYESQSTANDQTAPGYLYYSLSQVRAQNLLADPSWISIYGDQPDPVNRGGISADNPRTLVIGYLIPTQSSSTSSMAPRIVGWQVYDTSSTTTRATDVATQTVITGTAGADTIRRAAPTSSYPVLFRGAIDTGAGDDLIELASGQNSVEDLNGDRDPRLLDRTEDWGQEIYAPEEDSGRVYTANYDHGLGAWIDAGSGNDTVRGTDGADVIVGGLGNDVMDGQAGADTYKVGVHAGDVDRIEDVAEFDWATQDFAFIACGGDVLANHDLVVFDSTVSMEALSYRWDGSVLEVLNEGALFLQVVYSQSIADGHDAPALTEDQIRNAIDATRYSTHQTRDTIANRDISQAGVERFQFAGGESVALRQFLAMISAAPAENHAPTGSVTITGHAMQGQTLTVSDTLDDLDGLGAITYEWLRDGEALGHTGLTYVLSEDDVGAKIEVAALYTDALGANEVVFSAQTDTVSALITDVQSAVSYAMNSTDVTLTLTGAASVNGTGNALSNTITGNDANNILDGAGGDDLLLGGLGDDVLHGGAGDDTLIGSEGNDLLLGGTGDDYYVVETSADQVIELEGEGDDDWVSAKATFTLSENIEGLQLTAGDKDGTGNSLDNSINGGSGNNRLSGLGGDDYLYSGAGNDTLDGGTGADYMVGGSGNDTYIVDNASDLIGENLNQGTDLVQSSVTWTLGANFENLTLVGAATIDGTGNGLTNTITGNDAANVLNGQDGDDLMFGGLGNDTLYGGAGDDNLTGGAGNDQLRGGAGDDYYVVETSTDQVIELEGEGDDDWVYAKATFTLGDNIEGLQLTAGNKDGTGNSLDNSITASSGSNRLDGAGGNDYLSGGGGNDTYVGGLGDDGLFSFSSTSNDVYIWGRGEGADGLNDTGGTDRLDVMAGVAADQLWLRHVGDNLELSVIGTSDTFTINGWYASAANQVESFQLSDGKVLTAGHVQSLVDGMASFSAPSAGQTTLPANYQTALNPTIAANWA